MALRFTRITAAECKRLEPGKALHEHGIVYEKLANGDGRWRVKAMIDGQMIHRVIGRESEGVTRSKVEEALAQFKTDARHDRLSLPKGRKIAMTFAVAATKYLEHLKETGGKDITAKERILRLHLVPFFGKLVLGRITKTDVDRYKAHRQSGTSRRGGYMQDKSGKGSSTHPVAAATIVRELAVFSGLMNVAVELGWSATKPGIIRPAVDNARITYLTNEQAGRLLDAAAEDICPALYGFIRIGLETGMRKSEILSIRVENIDIERRRIFLPVAKAGSREQPITEGLADYLRSIIQESEGWLFPAGRANSTGHFMRINVAFRRAVIAAGLDPKTVTPHTLRHTAVTHLVQGGVPLPTVQQISGHKTLSMVARYAHTGGDHITAAMDVLEKSIRPKLDQSA